mmetsp:Transcript_20425/g.47963  ORF Transcript_20425/g.47963 Transcript_20425/m.47963 type:complete len:320 (+) Transcript_20425:140-1099(+)
MQLSALSLAALFLSSAALGGAAAGIEDISQLESLAPGFGNSPPAIGRNIDGGSVFTNFFRAYTDRQFFVLNSVQNKYETPGTKLVELDQLMWCADLSFTNFEDDDVDASGDASVPIMGFTGHCLWGTSITRSTFLESGAQMSTAALLSNEFNRDLSVSGVFVPQSNGFDVNWHINTDNMIWRMLDDGRSTGQLIGWEVHDEGDLNPNAASSSFSSVGRVQWISANETAALMDMDVTELTPEQFMPMYKKVWTENHEMEAIVDNPNPEAEMEIVEKAKDGDDGDSIMAMGDEEDTSTGSGRRLGSITPGVLSVALRIFGL